MDGIFKGRWIIQFDEERWTYPRMLTLAAEIQRWLEEKCFNPRLIRVNLEYGKPPVNKIQLNPGKKKGEIDEILIRLDQADLSFLPEASFGFAELPLPEVGLNIKKILLAHPCLATDSRWQGIELTGAGLFLGSALCRERYEVEFTKLGMPIGEKCDLSAYDLIGITLYEDLFLAVKDFLSDQKTVEKTRSPLWAAGGPMVTLNPLAACYHLPEINLFIRGEGEEVFPALLEGLVKNDWAKLWRQKGWLFHIPGLILISQYSQVNRMEKFLSSSFSLSFLSKDQWQAGLEINLSRGCRRRCLFCSQVHGWRLRQLPLHLFEDLLGQFDQSLKYQQLDRPEAKRININDDDILQDPVYAGEIFSLIKKHGFHLWGIQCNIESLLEKDNTVDETILALIDQPDLYCGRPLLWLGTDIFTPKRAKRLGKKTLAREQLLDLLNRFEDRKIESWHYWIASDYGTDWPEFVDELLFIIKLKKRFAHFGLLPHSPFLIPYPSTPLFRLLLVDPRWQGQIKFRRQLLTKDSLFYFPLVERVETRFSQLNRLLLNIPANGSRGFFHLLKEENTQQALICVYQYLRQERMMATSVELASDLLETEKRVEEFLALNFKPEINVI